MKSVILDQTDYDKSRTVVRYNRLTECFIIEHDSNICGTHATRNVLVGARLVARWYICT